MSLWIDESYRDEGTGIYVLGAAIGDRTTPTSALTSIVGPRGYLHWSDRPERPRVHEAINVIRPHVVLCVCHGVRRRRQEAARARCLDRLLVEHPTTDVRIERREDDSHDRNTVRNVDRRDGTAHTLSFVGKTSSAWLWIADAVVGMASAYYSGRQGSDHWWRTLRPECMTLWHIDA